MTNPETAETHARAAEDMADAAELIATSMVEVAATLRALVDAFPPVQRRQLEPYMRMFEALSKTDRFQQLAVSLRSSARQMRAIAAAGDQLGAVH